MVDFRMKRKRNPSEDGPCYDLCMCRYCWRGWSDLSLRSKVKYRIAYIWHVHVRRSTWR